jgi:leucyl aminopeptidase
VVCGWDGNDNLSTLGRLPMTLPEGTYALTSAVSDLQLIGWGLGGYQFLRYKDAKRAPAKLLLPARR